MESCCHRQRDESWRRAFRAVGLFGFGCLVLVFTSIDNIFFEYAGELKVLYKMSHWHVEVMSACFLFGTFFVLPFNLVYEECGFYGSNCIGFALAGSGLLLSGMAAMMQETFQNLTYLVALFQFMISHGRAHLYYLTIHVAITVTPEKHRGKAMGLMVSLVVVGQMLFTEIYYAKFNSKAATSYFFFFGFCTTTISTGLYVIFYAMTTGCCCKTADESLAENNNYSNSRQDCDDLTLLDDTKKKTYSTFKSILNNGSSTRTGCCKILNKNANKVDTNISNDFEIILTESELDDDNWIQTGYIQAYYSRYLRKIKVYNKNLQDSFKAVGRCENSPKVSYIGSGDYNGRPSTFCKEGPRIDKTSQSSERNICDRNAIFEMNISGDIDQDKGKCLENNRLRKTDPRLKPASEFSSKICSYSVDNEHKTDIATYGTNIPSNNFASRQSDICDSDNGVIKRNLMDRQEKSDFWEILKNCHFQLFLWPSATVIFSAFLFLNNIGLVLQSMELEKQHKLMTLSNLFVTLICRIVAGIFYDIFENDFNRILMLTAASICNVLSYVLSSIWMESSLMLYLAVLSNGASMGVSLTTCLAHCGNILGFVNKGRVQAILMTVVGVALFASSLLIGYVYDVIGQRETTRSPDFICYGAKCYQMSYLFVGILNALGTGLLCILLKTTLSRKPK